MICVENNKNCAKNINKSNNFTEKLLPKVELTIENLAEMYYNRENIQT